MEHHELIFSELNSNTSIGNLFQRFIEENLNAIEGSELHATVKKNLETIKKNMKLEKIKSESNKNLKDIIIIQKVKKNGVEKEVKINQEKN